jgi:uncharacterized protein (TIGR03437 family)
MRPAKALLLALFLSVQGRSQIQILTANGDNTRANANLYETQLTPATVSPSTFGKLGIWQVDGQVYAQPLYVSGLNFPDGTTHNVVFVATMHNSVYAFDADSPSAATPLWQVNLGPSVPTASLFGPYGDIYLEVGILSTGAIDPGPGVLYLVADVQQGGAPVFFLHALDLTTGQERQNGPVAISASASGTGSESVNGVVPFDPLRHIQRPGLLLANGAVYIGFGSHGDQSPWHGWLLSYDSSDLTHQFGIYLSTPNGNGGSFWRSLTADASGGLYSVTGNGDFDGATNFSQSFIKLTGAAPVIASNYTSPDWESMSDNDFDLAAGPALAGGTHTVIGADKQGQIYVLNGDSLPQGAQVIQATANSIFTLALWSRPNGTMIYVQGEQEPLKCFQLVNGTLNPAPISIAAASVPFGRIGMTLTANGAADGTGILWETTGNYNDLYATGTLHAYDASNLGNEVWNSDMSGNRDTMAAVAKFASPTVANGMVYVPTFGNSVVIYGLLGSLIQGPNPPSISAVTNAASYESDAVSPGEIVAIFGANLGPDPPVGMQVDRYGVVTNSLGGVQVLFDGVAAPMVFASATQINAVVPFGLTADTTQVQVVNQGQTSDPVAMTVTTSTPGIFSSDASGSGQGAILNQDNSVNSPDHPAMPGSIVTVWATGAGQLSPPGIDGSVVSADSLPLPLLRVTAQVGGQPAPVQYAGGAPGMVEGVLQINVQIPDNVRSSATLMVQLGDRQSQTGLTVSVQPRSAAAASAGSGSGPSPSRPATPPRGTGASPDRSSPGPPRPPRR